jgi:hypothetical protein
MWEVKNIECSELQVIRKKMQGRKEAEIERYV